MLRTTRWGSEVGVRELFFSALQRQKFDGSRRSRFRLPTLQSAPTTFGFHRLLSAGAAYLTSASVGAAHSLADVGGAGTDTRYIGGKST